MPSSASASREIAASPAAVFAAITDITRMGEWSPETVSAEWEDGYSAAEVGAKYTGHNRNGDKEWSILATITELEQDRRFVFECSSRDYVFSKWGYEIEPTETGCVVTEFTEDFRPESANEIGYKISGVSDRGPHNQAGIEKTLERLAAALE